MTNWLSGIRKSKSSYPGEDEVVRQRMASLDPSAVDETPGSFECGWYSTGEGDDRVYEAFGEEEEEVAQEWGEEQGEEQDVYRGNRGFEFQSASQQPHSPQPMFVLVQTDKIFPLTFGPPAQMQNVASNTPRARPVARHLTQHHSQQPRKQSYGTIPNWVLGSQNTHATRTVVSPASESQRHPSYSSNNTQAYRSLRQGLDEPSRVLRGTLGEGSVRGPFR